MRYILGIKIIFIFGEGGFIDDIFFISIILSYHTTLMKIEIEMCFYISYDERITNIFNFHIKRFHLYPIKIGLKLFV